MTGEPIFYNIQLLALYPSRIPWDVFCSTTVQKASIHLLLFFVGAHDSQSYVAIENTLGLKNSELQIHRQASTFLLCWVCFCNCQSAFYLSCAVSLGVNKWSKLTKFRNMSYYWGRSLYSMYQNNGALIILKCILKTRVIKKCYERINKRCDTRSIKIYKVGKG